MSVWGEMLNRSTGDAMRKEDKISTQNIDDQLNGAITFVGNIDKQSLPSAPSVGNIYFTNDKIKINGIEYPSGTLLLYDGKTWHNMGNYVHTPIDALNNIGYYQPVDVQESSII